MTHLESEDENRTPSVDAVNRLAAACCTNPVAIMLAAANLKGKSGELADELLARLLRQGKKRAHAGEEEAEQEQKDDDDLIMRRQSSDTSV